MLHSYLASVWETVPVYHDDKTHQPLPPHPQTWHSHNIVMLSDLMSPDIIPNGAGSSKINLTAFFTFGRNLIIFTYTALLFIELLVLKKLLLLSEQFQHLEKIVHQRHLLHLLDFLDTVSVHHLLSYQKNYSY